MGAANLALRTSDLLQFYSSANWSVEPSRHADTHAKDFTQRVWPTLLIAYTHMNGYRAKDPRDACPSVWVHRLKQVIQSAPSAQETNQQRLLFPLTRPLSMPIYRDESGMSSILSVADSESCRE